MVKAILTDVKKTLGIPSEETHFDSDIVMFINNALFTLRQLGVGPEEGYVIENDSDTWEELVGDDNLQSVKTYVYLSTKLLFDPPSNNPTVLESMKSHLKEIEWRLMIQADKKGE